MTDAMNHLSHPALQDNAQKVIASPPKRDTNGAISIVDRRRRFDARLYDRSHQEAELLRLYTSLSSSENKDGEDDGDDENSPSFILISGPNGTGKTTLAKTLKEHVMSDGGYFIVGKFDQLQRPEPYAAFVAAFTEFTNLVLARGNRSVTQMKDAINGSIKAEGRMLTDVIPALERIIGSNSEPVNNRGSEAIMRFLYVFRVFVRAVCSPQTPLVLLLDDLHWADSCSLDLLASLVSDRHTKGMIFVATSQEDADEEGSRLFGFFSRLRTEKVVISNIRVTNLQKDTVHEMMKDLFHLQHAASKALTELVCNQTSGNALHIVEFLRSLEEDNVLKYDNDTMKWSWNENETHLTMECRHLGDLLVSKVKKLSSSLQEVLKVAACLGSRLDESLLSHALSAPVSCYLKMAADHGILDFDERSGYTFSHDEIQEASYLLIAKETKAAVHVAIGRKLSKCLSSEELDKYIYVVLHQFCRGSSLIRSQREKYAIAALCLRAGEKAVAASSFHTASNFLACGINLLGDNHWREEYEMSLSLYDAAAEVEYCTANFDRVDAMVSAVFQNARCFRDKVQAHGTEVYALGARDKMQEAIDSGLLVLRELGEGFPSHPGKVCVALELMRTKRLLRGMSNECIMRLPQMKDREKVAAMQMMNLLFMYSYMARPLLSPLIAMRLVKLSVLYGLSVMSSIGFAVYGVVLSGFSSDYLGGYQYGQLALALLEKFQTKVWLPRVHTCVYGSINGWVKPIHESIEPLKFAHQVGLETGDIEFAFMGASIYCFMLYTAGKPLSFVESEAISVLRMIDSYKQESAQLMLSPFLQMVRSLMGKPEESIVPPSKGHDPSQGVERSLDHRNVITEFWFHYHKMAVAYLFCEYATAAEEADMCRVFMPMSREVGMSSVVFLDGLIMLARWKQSKCQDRKALSIVHRHIRQLDKWSRFSPQNCLNKCCLLQAELAAIKGSHDRAYRKYTYAIALAADSAMLMEHAIANERAGRYMLERGNESSAAPYFRQAHSSYVAWGAVSKAKRLKDEVSWLL